MPKMHQLKKQQDIDVEIHKSVRKRTFFVRLRYMRYGTIVVSGKDNNANQGLKNVLMFWAKAP